MLTVKFITIHNEPWLRQFPKLDGIFDGVKFIFNPEADNYDFLVVYDSHSDSLPNLTMVPRQQRILVATEPPNVKQYGPLSYLEQFGTLLTVDSKTPHSNLIVSPVGLPWHVGAFCDLGQHTDYLYDLNFYEQFQPQKTKLASIVSSNKAFTKEHRQRLKFFHHLKTYFGDEIDFFGRGLNTFEDKMDVLSQYRYHIALENLSSPYYWTEKISDPFMTLTYPIYYGCTNLDEYFPARSFAKINIADYKASILTIRRTIESDYAERYRPELIEARRLVLHEYNLFALLSFTVKKISKGIQISQMFNKQEIFTERQFISLKERLWNKSQIMINKSNLIRQMIEQVKRLLSA